jgi:hypothetical protein
MKIRTIWFSLVVSMFLIKCNLLTNVSLETITPSYVIVSENRDVSGFNASSFLPLGRSTLSRETRSR